MRRPEVSWHLFRDVLSGLLAAGIAGTLLLAWWGNTSGDTPARRMAAMANELRAAQREQPGGAAASRQRLAALEADLARLQKEPAAQAPVQSRGEMQRWLTQNAAAQARETVGISRLLLGLLAILAVALLVLTLSRLPARLRSGH